ncbi:FAD-binding oxidoreductase [Colwellia sp. MEBiC06753]
MYESLKQFEGSISAEHGIGIDKKPYLSLTRSTEELALMQQIKTLDSKNLLNPNKLF